MPRRRALRMLGGALVTVAVPFARPGLPAARASGLSPTKCGDPGTCANPRFPIVCGCDFLEGCYRDCCAPGDTCCKRSTGGPGPPCEKACCPPGTKCGSGKPGEPACVSSCDEPCGSECCKPDEFCANPRRLLCCKKGERACGGSRCCAPNEECQTVRVGTNSQSVCEKRCPQGRAWCGKDKCCPPKWRCANPATGLCKRCQPNEEECEKKCCDRQTSRCCGKAGCCPKSRSCCVTASGQKCCPRGQKCAVPILPGDIGIKPGTSAICCPQERYRENPKLCCPAGQVALRGPGIRVGPGLSPFCCPRGQTCGSGANRTCCQRGLTGNESCCGGKCVDLQFDPSNCGSCGNVCPSGVCGRGICALP